ncbi:myocardial zonula adherens protein isoform X2 [Cynoglossus semilaevis]|uniref:Myocardial zonula adherens protein n=1 Tax=Cynoglossus semilaevis TaxID=244447 RepID=A0A3P8WSW8_CYNSE|nr:myocardial zonula adherens protein-like isoform X2 [Cynoglossus semilaevis]
MLRYGSGRNVSTTTTTTEDSAESLSERRIRRLRLTLHAGDNGNNEPKTANSETADRDKDVSGAWKKKNGLIQRQRPAGSESPQQLHKDSTNGVPESSSEHHGPKVYGVVQRKVSDRQQEVMAREWTVNHLQDEMRYIREVRDSLEKVRERMYGQFGGMQQSVQRLSHELRTSNAHRRSLESEVRVRTAAMDSFDQMNSSLISANISLQKSLLENCQDRMDSRDSVKNLRSNYEKTQEKLRDKERELAAAEAENQTLRLQVESSREANAKALQELSEKLQKEYEEKLQEEQQKHREEIEKLQAQLDEYIRRLEEAERSISTAEAQISERDQRIVELERLLDCMGKEKGDLQKKLQECEQRLRLLELTDTTDAVVTKRTKQLQSEAGDLRERIKHLNDMVFCQQRKVKGMIEEVQSLRAQVAQKDMFISELLDRIAIVECENNELEDKLKYFMSSQNRPQEILETREISIGCDLPHRYELLSYDVDAPHLHPLQLSPSVQPIIPKKPSSPSQSSSSTLLLSIAQPFPPSQSLSSTNPLSPTQSLSPAQILPSTQPLPSNNPPTSNHPMSSTLPPLSPIQSLSPTPSLSPTQSLSPTLSMSPTPMSPTLSMSPTPLSPTLCLSPPQPLSPTQTLPFTQTSPHSSPIQFPSRYLSLPTQPRTFRPGNPPPSRLESSLLRYTPIQYSRLLQSNSSPLNTSFSYTPPSAPEHSANLVQTGVDEVDSGPNTSVNSNLEESASFSSLYLPRSRAPQVSTPFMKLMETTAQINIDDSSE